MEIIKSDKSETVAANLVNEKLHAGKNQSILLLLSGGSWLSVYEKINAVYLDSRITIGMLDERYSDDKNVNNFAQFVQTHIYKEAVKNGVNFIDTRINADETLCDLAERFENSLRMWREQNPSGIVIVTMGLGEDGHTAGIFSTLDISDSLKDAWVVGYEIDELVNQFTKRVTVTPCFLIHEVQQTICYVIGENKCVLLKQILSEDSKIGKLPVHVWHEMKDVKVVTDCQI